MLSYINNLLLLLEHMFSCTNLNCTVWQVECLANFLFSNVWQKKVWRMNRSAKGLLIVTTNLDGFSLVNHR